MPYFRTTLATIAAILPAAVSVAADRPNVVVFYADDLGWTDWQQDAVLNPNGSVVFETPNLLRLAQSGLTFTDAYAAAPVCSPSRASLLTGETPARHGYTDHSGGGSNVSATLQSPSFARTAPTGDVTIAEALGSTAGGYDTGFIGKWHVAGTPQASGFDVNVAGGGSGCPCDGEGGFFAGPDGRWSGMPGISTPGTYASDAYLTDVLAGFAENYIQQQAAGPEPFYLQFSTYQVHVPLQAPAATVSKYAAKIAQLNSQGVELHGHDEPTYAAMVEEMDNAIGRILDRLEDPNGDGNSSDSVRDNTIVVFASDNGGLTVSELGYPIPTSNGPLREGKGSLYEGGVRTPLVVSWTGNPAMAQGATTDAVASISDLYPTLLEATGSATNAAVPRNDQMDGVSFLPALLGQTHQRAPIVWHYPHRSNQQEVSGGSVTGGSFVSGVREGDLKLIYFYEDRHYEMYDLVSDLSETTDLLAGSGTVSDDAFRLSAAMHAHLLRVGAATPVNRSTGLSEPLPAVLWQTMQGDFNGDDQIDSDDWDQLRSAFGADLAALHAADAYALGDFDLDGKIGRNDFAAFKDAYDADNGAGAFSRLLSGVPEPATIWLLTFTLGGASTRRRGRR